MRAGLSLFRREQGAGGAGQDRGARPRPTWHLIGHLQGNKAREAVRLFDSNDSVDRADLGRGDQSPGRGAGQDAGRAVAGERRAGEHEVRLRAGGRARAGRADQRPAAAAAQRPDDHRTLFAGGGEIAAATSPRCVTCASGYRPPRGLALPVLSMGMSGDFAVAIEGGRDAGAHRHGALRPAAHAAPAAAGGSLVPRVDVTKKPSNGKRQLRNCQMNQINGMRKGIQKVPFSENSVNFVHSVIP